MQHLIVVIGKASKGTFTCRQPENKDMKEGFGESKTAAVCSFVIHNRLTPMTIQIDGHKGHLNHIEGQGRVNGIPF